MYKCRECGAKYETKPDYCECGNDTFVKVLSTNTSSNIKIADQKPDDFDSDIEDFREIQEDQDFNNRNTFNELPQANNDKLSVGIFAGCIFLAFLILFFIGNPKKEPTNPETKQETVAQTPKDIPSLDTFWDNTPIKIQPQQPEQPKEEKPMVEIPIVAEIPRIVQQIIPQQKPQEQKPAVKNTTPKTTTKPVQQTVQKPKTTTTTATKPATPAKTTSSAVTKPAVNTTKPTTTTQTPNIITKIKNTQPTQPTQTQQTTQTPKVTAQTQQTQQTTTTQAPKPTATTQTTTTVQNTQAQQAQQAALEAQQKAAAAAQAAKQAAAAKQELANYKNSLRNAIGRKIDFTSVVGDGSCSLSFKIASNGRLTNRVFTNQSSNLTLNEAVYSAMNATPSYNPPPEAYKNETLNLTIRFYNGNFEISLN